LQGGHRTNPDGRAGAMAARARPYIGAAERDLAGFRGIHQSRARHRPPRCWRRRTPDIACRRRVCRGAGTDRLLELLDVAAPAPTRHAPLGTPSRMDAGGGMNDLSQRSQSSRVEERTQNTGQVDARRLHTRVASVGVAGQPDDAAARRHGRHRPRRGEGICFEHAVYEHGLGQKMLGRL